MKHPNNVIEHGDWTVVRNESTTLDIEAAVVLQMPTQLRYYYTYHEHEHERNSGFYNMNRVYMERVEKMSCKCGVSIPDEVLGALIMIKWSDEHAIIR